MSKSALVETLARTMAEGSSAIECVLLFSQIVLHRVKEEKNMTNMLLQSILSFLQLGLWHECDVVAFQIHLPLPLPQSRSPHSRHLNLRLLNPHSLHPFLQHKQALRHPTQPTLHQPLTRSWVHREQVHRSRSTPSWLPARVRTSRLLRL